MSEQLPLSVNCMRCFIRPGIIGCGRLGSHLAHCLLTLAEVRPCFLKISTRRPETLSKFTYHGINVHIPAVV